MAPPKKAATKARLKDDSETSQHSTPAKASSPKVYSPAKRRHADFAAASSESESEDSVVVVSPAAARLKMTGEDDSGNEGKKGKDSDHEESSENEDENGGDGSSSERERHEIHPPDSSEEQDTGNEEEEEQEPVVCVSCGSTPCIWVRFELGRAQALFKLPNIQPSLGRRWQGKRKCQKDPRLL